MQESPYLCRYGLQWLYWPNLYIKYKTQFSHLDKSTIYQYMSGCTFLIPTGEVLWYHCRYWLWALCIHIYIKPTLVYPMPTPGPTTSPRQWECSILMGSLCHMCNEVNGRNCHILHAVRILRVRWKILAGKLKLDELSVPKRTPHVAEKQHMTPVWAWYHIRHVLWKPSWFTLRYEICN